MEPWLWIALSGVVFLVLVFIGVRPLLPSWRTKRVYMNLEEYKQWLSEQAHGANPSVEIMSGELPPGVYDSVADILMNKPEVTVRVLTEKTVLCSPSEQTNKLVEATSSGQARNIELRTLDNLPANHIIFDRRVAWVGYPHPYGDTQYNAGFVVEDPIKVSVYLADFEWYWNRAVRHSPVCTARKR